jgi:glutathionyl-hydroquinone reductase
MGRLVDGQWTTEWYQPDEEGRFVRSETSFRRWVGGPPDRAASNPEFTAVDGRYHLYVSWACPWAHRTLIARALHGLDHTIDISVVDHFMGAEGWRFDPEVPGASADHIHGARYLREVYTAADPEFTGRVTVPVLWDKQGETIVNNESREIVRMFNDRFAALAQRKLDLAPAELRDEVERVIDAIYEPINNGVYKAGFASSQRAYDEAVTDLFAGLDHWDEVLGRQRWLAGERLTEADIFLFTTLIRFDLVYHTHFKCNRRRIVDYPNLSGFVREIYQLPGVAQTCNFEHIRRHYYASHEGINPQRIVAIGPDLELDREHGREAKGGLSGLALLD